LQSTTDLRPLLVLALGGHAIGSSKFHSYARERQQVTQLRAMLIRLDKQGYRLLIVHGNGPQVGHLLTMERSVIEAQTNADVAAKKYADDLDIYTAQTQGEIGYLLSKVLPAPNVSLMTRVIVSEALGPPIKPIGPALESPLNHTACRRFPTGWRVIVPSPRPSAVVEIDLIKRLLNDHHVIAGGGGGIPQSPTDEPLQAVIDKDWVAALFSIAYDAHTLVFATDVEFVYTDFEMPSAHPNASLSVSACRRLLDNPNFGQGSMAPKLAAALQFVETTGVPAHICAVHQIEQALVGNAGTRVSW
jgi:carbamate kinase